MSNVVKFPKPARPAPVVPPAAAPAARAVDAKKKSRNPIAILQIVVALLWPILKWVVALDVTWQFARMLYHWNTPGVFAGWTFLVHFAVFVGLIYFVSIYRPKGGI